MNALPRRHAFWKAYCCYLAAVAMPVSTVVYNDAPDSFTHGLAVVLTFQLLPPFVLATADMALGRFAAAFRFAIYVLSIVVLVRLVQRFHVPALGWLYEIKYVIMAVALVASAAAAFLLLRIERFVCLLGVLSLLLPAWYLWRAEPAAGSGTVAAQTHAPIFVVLFDELSLEILLDRGGLIDVARFPNFAAFAAESIWFRKAVSNYAYTRFSLASMFSRQQLQSGGAGCVRVYCGALFTTLAQNGILPPAAADHSLHRYLSAKFARLLTLIGARSLSSVFGPAWHYSHALEIDSLMSTPISDNRIYYYHLLLTHAPYVHDPDGLVSPSPFTVFRVGTPMERVLERYVANTMYADRVFGDFIRKLRNEGLYDRALIIFTSDHGECWTPHCPGRENPADVMDVPSSLARVPLMIRSPGVAPRVDDSDYQHIDFTPTLLAAAGVKLGEAGKTGRSALERGQSSRRVYFSVTGEWNDRIDITEKVR